MELGKHDDRASEKRATCVVQEVKKTTKREERVLAMSEDLKARVEPALKTKEECQDDFEECQRSCDEAEVISGAKRVQGRDFEKKLPKRRRISG